MQPARSTRYAGDDVEEMIESAKNKRKGTSSTISTSSDGRRMHSKTKRVSLDPKAPSASGSRRPHHPPSSVLTAALRKLPRQPFNNINDNTFDFDLDLDPFDRDFYDNNTGGFDDDYVETNLDKEDEGEVDGSGAVAPNEEETVCGVDDQGVVVHLSDVDVRKSRSFASVHGIFLGIHHYVPNLIDF